MKHTVSPARAGFGKTAACAADGVCVALRETVAVAVGERVGVALRVGEVEGVWLTVADPVALTDGDAVALDATQSAAGLRCLVRTARIPLR